ncbi:REP-associated tyrosine transposase [Lacinutrix himadriensis]|uniref:REP-associated tyrosine transposase n=1 Tax=Lacinutrix himadriensis TaxID=641549 RepID=UPI0006E16C14|nr:transposase [Lacinutrix himadriensis]
MSTKYKATMAETGYFVTITTVGWIDVFTRLKQRYVIINALDYCQKQKGLEIYAYCVMSNHIHMLCKAKEGYLLSNIMRDFKKYTSKQIIKTLINYPESRREWILDYFKKACNHLKREQNYKVWQNGYHAEICSSNTFIKQKLDYIHNNPVKDKIVANPEDYVFSSARNYAGLDYELEVLILTMF